MACNVNVDCRFSAGYPQVSDALRHGARWVRCISLPDNESQAAAYLAAGIRVLAVYTGESNNAGLYVMQACSALQIGNEPEFVMQGGASWPTGSADDMVNVWSHVANVLVPSVHPEGLPLVGPGIWPGDYAGWAQVASRLPKLSAAATHVYPDTLGWNVTTLRLNLSKFRNVRADLPLWCTEWNIRHDVLAFARAIDSYCDVKLWYSWGPGEPGHELVGTPEFGIVALAS